MQVNDKSNRVFTMSGATKDLISLVGQLDWQVNHGSMDKAKKKLTEIKRKVTLIDKIIKEQTTQAISVICAK